MIDFLICLNGDLYREHIIFYTQLSKHDHFTCWNGYTQNDNCSRANIAKDYNDISLASIKLCIFWPSPIYGWSLCQIVFLMKAHAWCISSKFRQITLIGFPFWCLIQKIYHHKHVLLTNKCQHLIVVFICDVGFRSSKQRLI